jgi:hypothetical protein
VTGDGRRIEPGTLSHTRTLVDKALKHTFMKKQDKSQPIPSYSTRYFFKGGVSRPKSMEENLRKHTSLGTR